MSGEKFYSTLGWKMFDLACLDGQVLDYLQAEIEALHSVVKGDAKGLKSLIEVGCGYGRLLDWAVNNGHNYVGIDIISWLIEFGKLREKDLKVAPNLTVAFRQLNAKDISKLFIEMPLLKDGEIVVFFPFNLLGNISNPGSVARELGKSSLTVAISSFRPIKNVTQIRKAYYERCGFKNLTDTENENGVLITSSDGLWSYAYNETYIRKTFCDNNFQMSSKKQLSECGELYVFTRKGESLSAEDKRKYFRHKISAKIRVTWPKIEHPSADNSTGFAVFHQCQGLCVDISESGLSFTSDTPIRVGAPARIEFSSSATFNSLILVGIVIRNQKQNNGQIKIVVQMHSSLSTLESILMLYSQGSAEGIVA